ncbi:unnamed protein product [Cuscuta europaea]|uniref:Uncharacterized protein n=1 Tax=Cuscuta europaea TaxID=41803 RepID=A0A9P0ZCC3_CUSEU|nr:unnamed protein product [Cuscuta europaea]
MEFDTEICKEGIIPHISDIHRSNIHRKTNQRQHTGNHSIDDQNDNIKEKRHLSQATNNMEPSAPGETTELEGNVTETEIIQRGNHTTPNQSTDRTRQTSTTIRRIPENQHPHARRNRLDDGHQNHQSTGTIRNDQGQTGTPPSFSHAHPRRLPHRDTG